MENNHSSKDNEKMNMADVFVTAMFLQGEYGKLLKLKTGKVVGYLALLMLLISVIQYAIPVLGAIAGLGGIKNIMLNEIPQFALTDGTFSYEEKYEFDEPETGVYLLIDTKEDKFQKEDVPSDVTQAILVSKTNMLVANNLSDLGTIVQEDTFDKYKGVNITNQTLADASGLIYMMLGFMYVAMYLAVLIKYLFVGLFYALFFYLLTKTTMPDIELGKIVKAVMFAQTIGSVVVAVTYCVGNSLMILAGSIFNVMVTILIMNKVVFSRKESV